MTHPATLLKNSWRAYARDWRAWLILTAPLIGLGAIAFGIVQLLPQDSYGSIDFSTSAAWVKYVVAIGVIVIAAAFILVTRVFMTALTISSYHSLNGQKPNVKESIKVGFRTFWPVLWVAILRGLIVLGGLILLIVPGIIWALRYSLAVQAAAIEGKRGMAALHRSKDLTRGKIFATFVNYGVIGAIVGYGTWILILAVMIVFIVLGTMIMIVIPGDAMNTAVGDVVLVALMITAWFVKPLFPIASTSVYKDYSDN
jgi:hypothetical protein